MLTTRPRDKYHPLHTVRDSRDKTRCAVYWSIRRCHRLGFHPFRMLQEKQGAFLAAAAAAAELSFILWLLRSCMAR